MSRYRDALAWLYGLESRGIKLGLERMETAAALRGHPEKGLRYLHIGGTNGKGSVAAMCESMLRASGLRTGQFASPHLQRYVERVQIAGRPISEAEAARRIEELRVDTRLPPLSFFEYTTLLAFEAFRDAKCDVVVLEVGLGGRLDSTNIVDPAACIITNIGLEHQRILGDTHAKIAREKAGIIKQGVPVVVGTRGRSARRVITRRARKVGAPLRLVGRDFEGTRNDGSVRIRVGDRTYENVKLGLRGHYQVDNAACAVTGVHELSRVGIDVDERSIRKGLRLAKWPGRLEWCQGNPTFLFDAAHNASGCEALGHYLDDLAFPSKVVLLFGAMRDKDHRRMLAAFDDRVGKRVYVSSAVARSQRPERFAALRDGSVARSVRDGLARARRAAGQDGLVVVAGSVFVVSEVRALVKNTRTDPPIAM